MYKFNHVEKVRVLEIVEMNLSCPPMTRENLMEYLPAIDLVKAGITYVLANGLYEYPPLNIDEIGKNLVCENSKDLRKVLQEAIDREIADAGFYGRNIARTPDQLFYQILIQCIHEYGRKSDDIIEKVVLTNMDRIFDEQAVEDQEDMLVWSLLMEYLDDILSGRHFPFGKFIKERGSSTAKVQRFITKNSWYQNPEYLGRIFGIDREKPKLQEIIRSAIKVMAKEYQNLIDDTPQ